MKNEFINKSFLIKKGSTIKPLFTGVTTRGFVAGSRFSMFTLLNMQSVTICVTKAYTLDDFRPFLEALSRQYRFNLTSGSVITTLVDAIILHMSVYICCQSRFVNHIVNYSTNIRVPAFIHAQLLKISTEVNSRNKAEGFTKGTTHNLSTSEVIRDTLLELVDSKHGHDNILRLLSGTIFQKVCSDSRLRNEFNREFTSRVNELFNAVDEVGDSILFEKILNFLSVTPRMFYDSSNNQFPVFEGTLSSNTSQAISIFRFRNIDEYQPRYAVQQSSWVNIHETTRDFFCSYLNIFKPTFFQEGSHQPLYAALGPGEGILDLSLYNIVDCWEQFICFKVMPIPKGSGKGRKRKKPDTPVSDETVFSSQSNDSSVPSVKTYNRLVSTISPLIIDETCCIYTVVGRKTQYLGDLIGTNSDISEFYVLIDSKRDSIYYG